MKKTFKIIFNLLMLIIIAILSSCNIYLGHLSEQDTANEKMDSLIQCLEAKDKEGFKKLCASAQMEQSSTYESDIDALFQYYEGTYISKVGSVSTGDYSNWDYSYKDLGISYDVTTSIRTYRFCI